MSDTRASSRFLKTLKNLYILKGIYNSEMNSCVNITQYQ